MIVAYPGSISCMSTVNVAARYRLTVEKRDGFVKHL